jgi:hypothetical protein
MKQIITKRSINITCSLHGVFYGSEGLRLGFNIIHTTPLLGLMSPFITQSSSNLDFSPSLLGAYVRSNRRNVEVVSSVWSAVTAASHYNIAAARKYVFCAVRPESM